MKDDFGRGGTGFPSGLDSFPPSDKRPGAGCHCGDFAVGVKTLQRAGAARLLQSFIAIQLC